MLEGVFRRRRLPHWDVADATYFITTCLAGSVPAAGLKALNGYRAELNLRPCPGDLTQPDWELRKHKLVFKRLDELLDHEPAVCHLADPELVQIVYDALCFFAGDRYDLLAFVVMPSHFHWVISPTRTYCEAIGSSHDRRTPRERIMKSIKGYTARQCNLKLRQRGSFWQDESFDHCVRDTDELLRIIEYIEQNPVKARLVSAAEQWPFSSAHHRLQHAVRAGDPLTFCKARRLHGAK